MAKLMAKATFEGAMDAATELVAAEIVLGCCKQLGHLPANDLGAAAVEGAIRERLVQLAIGEPDHPLLAWRAKVVFEPGVRACIHGHGHRPRLSVTWSPAVAG